MVDILMETGGDVNAVNSEGVTPVLLSVERGNMQMVSLLHDRGAKMDALRVDGVGVVALTIMHGHENLLGISKQLMGCWGPEHTAAKDVGEWVVEIVSALLTPLWIESRLLRNWRKTRDGEEGRMCKQLSFIIGFLGSLGTPTGQHRYMVPPGLQGGLVELRALLIQNAVFLQHLDK